MEIAIVLKYRDMEIRLSREETKTLWNTLTEYYSPKTSWHEKLGEDKYLSCYIDYN